MRRVTARVPAAIREKMKRELEFFTIGNAYGGSQRWMRSVKMRVGGCGAITASDSSILLARDHGLTAACPPETVQPTRENYVALCHRLEDYLWPRRMGIDRIEIFMDGYEKYLHEAGIDCVAMTGLHGDRPYAEAREAVRAQIDKGLPVPMLLLRHKNRRFRDYNWHWFPLIGYEETEDRFLVKLATYGIFDWLDFADLWDTGHEKKGGLVLFSLERESAAAVQRAAGANS